MCEGRFHFGSLRYKGNNTSKVAYCSNTNSVLELESEWIKHRKLSSYTAHVVRSSTSCMPWSCRIPWVKSILSSYSLVLYSIIHFLHYLVD
ncbi:hypothetical protein Ahy_A07g034542 [Arachis hypogaea]|uniref:Uncharacterized protein n=1 Tax=Arachis hypogaea TaxID=3818 RepID=A0A445CC81_ARAHY|nr:hypothetical protein Ahy_A07g034542 [Arachis hypogaea]